MTKQTLPMTQHHELAQEPFKPSDRQKERKAALKRFNRLYVFTPIITIAVIFVLIIVSMVIAVFYMSINNNVNEKLISFISGLADITVIIFTLPLIIIMISGPLLLGVLINNSRNRRKMGKSAFDQGGKLQVLLWRMDKFMEQIQTKTNEVAPRMADQVIRFNESIAYIKGFIQQITSYFKRSS